jgi:hypothetical protein
MLPFRLQHGSRANKYRNIFPPAVFSTGMRLRFFIYAMASLALLLCYAPFHFASDLLQSGLRRVSGILLS